MQSILSLAQIISGFFMIILILLQHGKGASMGSAFGGGGGSQTVFGAGGSFSFFAKLTAVLAIIFFGSSVYLTFLNNHAVKQGVIEQIVPKIVAPQTTIPEQQDKTTPSE